MEKMTDVEIIKAVEICESEELSCEDGCPYNGKTRGKDACFQMLRKDALDLVKRLQSENAELKSELTITKNNFENAQKLYDESVKISQRMQEKLIVAYKKIKTAKSEGIKRFWMFVRDYVVSQTLFAEYEEGRMTVEYGDNLIKEMAGDINETREESDCQTEEAP